MSQRLLDEAEKILHQNIALTDNEKKSLLNLLQLLFDLAEKTYPDNASLETFLHQLSANLLASSHLLSIIQELNDELNAVKRLSVSISSSLELQKVLDNIVGEAMVLIKNVRTAHIFLYQNGELSFGAAGFDDSSGRQKPFAQPRPNGLTTTVAHRGEIIVVPNMQDHPLYFNKPADWYGSIIGLPIKIGDRVVGVMNISRHHTGDFSRREIYLLQMLSEQAAIAIENARLHQIVIEQANRDTLTGLPNRRALDKQLENEVQRSLRNGRPFSVVMIDLDGFKNINDTYGHVIGDDILKQVAQILYRNIRSIDFLARYGGDELTIILPETSAEHGKYAIEKLHETLNKHDIMLPRGKSTHIGFSAGLAEYPMHGASASNLLRAADAALYHAKKHCRGSVIIAGKPSSKLRNAPV